MDNYKYGKSITVIARLSGLSAPAVVRALQGRGTSFVNAYRMARAMEISLDEFWNRYYADGKSRIYVPSDRMSA